MAAESRSEAAPICSVVPRGATTTSWLERKIRRDASSTRPACCTRSIQASSADRKTSARPAARICRASVLLPAVWITRPAPTAACQEGFSSLSASSRLAAA
jgi:hypothetical protein